VVDWSVLWRRGVQHAVQGDWGGYTTRECGRCGLLRGSANIIVERTRVLQPHQAPPRRSHLLLHGEPGPRLLRRENWQRGRLPTVAEGPAGFQSQAGRIPGKQMMGICWSSFWLEWRIRVAESEGQKESKPLEKAAYILAHGRIESLRVYNITFRVHCQWPGISS